jgi:hypothetical protein
MARSIVISMTTRSGFGVRCRRTPVLEHSHRPAAVAVPEEMSGEGQGLQGQQRRSQALHRAGGDQRLHAGGESGAQGAAVNTASPATKTRLGP